ncbi:MAG: T9SS type A sorting domain-containing protein [Bacteroidota bacterium]
MNLKYFLFVPAFLLSLPLVRSQDTLTVMYYNVLSYTTSTYGKTHFFKDISKYIKPDILVLNEIFSDSGSVHVLDYVLNTDGDTNYDKADFTDGPDSDNMLFYNKNKIRLVSQDTIQTDLRIINEYFLYYNDSAFTAQYDSVLFNVYAAHLKASTGSSNEQQRLLEVQKFIQHLANGNDKKNILFGGDMNFYSSSEPALEYLIAPGPYQMYDPLDSIGYWHDNSLYARLHTQSTRVSAFGGGATGGMDDRFDFIFISSDLKNGGNYAKYINGTYWAFGNDGHHLNDSLLSLPQYNNLPDSITSSLYYMSDHLPVIMKIIINYDVSIPDNEIVYPDILKIFPNPASDFASITFPEPVFSEVNYVIETGTGKIISSRKLHLNGNSTFQVNLKGIENGIYFIRVSDNLRCFSGKISVLK